MCYYLNVQLQGRSVKSSGMYGSRPYRSLAFTFPFALAARSSGTSKAEAQLLLNQNSSASQPLLVSGFYSMERLTSTIFSRPTGATYTVQGPFQPIKAFPWVIRRNKSQLCLNETRSKIQGGWNVCCYMRGQHRAQFKAVIDNIFIKKKKGGREGSAFLVIWLNRVFVIKRFED